MFQLICDKNKCWVEQRDTLTQYSKGSDTVRIRLSYSQEWDDLNKIAVFRAYDTQIDVAVASSEIEIPVNVLLKPNVHLMVGIYGISDTGNVVIPTVWANLGIIQPAPNPTDAGNYGPPALDLYAQLAALVKAAEDAAQVAASGTYASEVTFSVRVSDGQLIMTVDGEDTPLGPVSAYATALDAGYTGSYADFKALLIANAQTAYNVAQISAAYETIAALAAEAKAQASQAASLAADARERSIQAQSAVNDKQSQHKAVTTTLVSGAHTWTKAVAGATASNLIIWGPAPESLDYAASVGLRMTTQDMNTVTFATVDEYTDTTEDISVNIAVFD